MSPEEYAKLPVQIVITLNERGYKVAIMSATETIETNYFAALTDAMIFATKTANHLHPTP